MINTILTEAGFVENKTYKETRFIKPPKTTYAVYMDAYERRGADSHNCITEHDYTVELYEYKKDPDAVSKLETTLDNHGIQFEKDGRSWIDSEQLYMTVYSFSYIEK